MSSLNLPSYSTLMVHLASLFPSSVIAITVSLPVPRGVIRQVSPDASIVATESPPLCNDHLIFLLVASSGVIVAVMLFSPPDKGIAKFALLNEISVTLTISLATDIIHVALYPPSALLACTNANPCFTPFIVQ